MIIGIGTDLVDIRRIERSLQRFGKRFEERVFTPHERERASLKSNPATTYAKRFAAKEAFLKARGTGFSGGVSFLGIEVRNDPKGRPLLILSPELRVLLEKDLLPQTQIRLDLSLSDEYPYAQAFVVISQEGI